MIVCIPVRPCLADRAFKLRFRSRSEYGRYGKSRGGGDGLTDYRIDGLGDPGCQNADSPYEDPQCQDGINNDGQIGTDFDGGESVLGAGNGDPNGPDPQCVSFRGDHLPWRDEEAGGEGGAGGRKRGCGLGWELVFLVPGLLWLRQRPRFA